MSLHNDDKYYLPSTLEAEDDHSMMMTDEYNQHQHQQYYPQQQQEPLKNYLSTRQLPGLDTIQNNYQNDDYIRIKLSGMSVGVSPNSSPRGHPQYQHEQRGGSSAEYFPPQSIERRDSKVGGLIYDPIRSSTVTAAVTETPLIRRIMHHDTSTASSQRRHSIANLDLNTRSTTSSTLNNNNIENNNITNIYQHHIQQYQMHQPPYPGHYSAPSSPPLHHASSHLKLSSIKPLPPFSPYNRLNKSSTTTTTTNNMDDDASPPPLQMRRNSSALLYRNSHNNSREHLAPVSRRMSSSSSSTSSSLHRINQIGNNNKVQEEEEEEEMIINRQQRDEMEGLYSRSPELRISHKLAERKRRKEMKDLFEELKDALPVDKSMKTSKWEILSKAVEYIGLLRHRDYSMEQELTILKQELENLKASSSSQQQQQQNVVYHQQHL